MIKLTFLMTAKKLPETSLEAYKQVTPEMLSEHHRKIVSALQVLGSSTYEGIANHVNLDRHQVGRRLSELERMQIVYKPGQKKPTKSGRMAYCYSLCITGPKTEKEFNGYKKGEKTSTDFSKELIQATQQQTLFP